MDSSSSDDELANPERLKTLAFNVETSDKNNLLHRFVLDNSDPNEPGSESYIGAVLRSMSGSPEVNVLNKRGFSALHLAVLKENLPMVKLLLSCLKNIDVDARCGQLMKNEIDIESTALHLAVRKGHLPIIQALLGAKADVNTGGRRDDTAFHLAINLYIIKLLEDEGADVNSFGELGSPLYAAARDASLAAVELLLKSGADVNKRDYLETPPLLQAAEYGRLDCVKLLINCGAVLAITNYLGETALHLAAQGGHLSTVEFLLNIGADVDAEEGWQRSTPLMLAAENEKFQVAEILLVQGANVHARDDNGWTPLCHAVCGDSLETCSLLVSHGADLTAVDNQGKTLLHVAAECGSLRAAELLLEGCNMNAVDADGWTPLHCAAYCNCEQFVRLLLEKGADRNVKNRDGKTPLDVAKQRGKDSCVKALQDI